MHYTITTATKKVASLKKRIRAVQGGTSASKTISILLVLINDAQADAVPTLTSVVSESHPHLRRGAMRDFLNIMKAQGYFKDENWNKTESTYTFETGSQIEFFGADDSSKLRGPRRQRLFLNECNNLPLDSFTQLEMRTDEYVFMDWNPSAEFWFHTDVVVQRDDVDFIILTYKDNEALKDTIVKSIESRKGNARWWKVYGLGQLGEVEGRIYTGWNVIDEIPHEARLERYCIDFGYTNDPTSINQIYYYNGGYIIHQVAYNTGMSNREIGETLKNLPRALIVADSAEPKSIDELRHMGLSVVPAKKGPDSIRNGINTVQEQRISVTKSSVDVIKEYRTYLWMADRDGNIMNDPVDFNNHAMDAIRYGFMSIVPQVNAQERAASRPHYPQQQVRNMAR